MLHRKIFAIYLKGLLYVAIDESVRRSVAREQPAETTLTKEVRRGASFYRKPFKSNFLYSLQKME